MLKSIIYMICKKQANIVALSGICDMLSGYAIGDILSEICYRCYAVGDILLGETLFYRYM